MNIYWEENDSADEIPKHWSENKIDGTVDLSEAIMNDTSAAFVHEIKSPPPMVGGYDITGGNGVDNSIVYNFTKKPNWFHRTCCRFFLGWKWNDKKENSNKNLLFG